MTGGRLVNAVAGIVNNLAGDPIWPGFPDG